MFPIAGIKIRKKEICQIVSSFSVFIAKVRNVDVVRDPRLAMIRLVIAIIK